MDLRIADQLSAFLWSVCYQIMPGFNDIFRLLLLVVAVTSDGFCAAFGLGASGIIIPPKSAAVISASGAAFLTISAALGGTAVSLIPSGGGFQVQNDLIVVFLQRGYFKSFFAIEIGESNFYVVRIF